MNEVNLEGTTHGFELATCIGCGCDDLHACEDHDGPCHWLKLDRSLGMCVCSECSAYIAQWDEGIHIIQLPANEAVYEV